MMSLHLFYVCRLHAYFYRSSVSSKYPHLDNVQLQWQLGKMNAMMTPVTDFLPQRANAFSRCTYMHAYTFTSALCWRVYTRAHAHTVVWLIPNSTRLVTSRLDTARHVRRVETSVSSVSSGAVPTMADDEQAIVLACTSLVVFMLLHTQILFVLSNKIN